MNPPIVVTHTFDVSAERLFAALDDHSSMGRWLGTRIDLITSPPDKGVGSVRRVHMGLQTIDEEVIEREVPKRIVYKVVRGLFPLSYQRGEIRVTSLGPHRASAEWKVLLESQIPGVVALVRLVVGRAIEKGLQKLAAELGRDVSPAPSPGA